MRVRHQLRTAGAGYHLLRSAAHPAPGFSGGGAGGGSWEASRTGYHLRHRAPPGFGLRLRAWSIRQHLRNPLPSPEHNHSCAILDSFRHSQTRGFSLYILPSLGVSPSKCRTRLSTPLRSALDAAPIVRPASSVTGSTVMPPKRPWRTVILLDGVAANVDVRHRNTSISPALPRLPGLPARGQAIPRVHRISDRIERLNRSKRFTKYYHYSRDQF